MNPDLLSQLRDIHSAPAAPFWPPAPGWWVLALLVLVCLVFLLRRLARHLQVRGRRRRLLEHLETLRGQLDPLTQPQAYLSAVNQLLKLVAIRAFPGQQCAGLQGTDWTGFISQQLEGYDAGPALQALDHGPYQPEPDFNPDSVEEIARNWIRRYG